MSGVSESYNNTDIQMNTVRSVLQPVEDFINRSHNDFTETIHKVLLPSLLNSSYALHSLKESLTDAICEYGEQRFRDGVKSAENGDSRIQLDVIQPTQPMSDQHPVYEPPVTGTSNTKSVQMTSTFEMRGYRLASSNSNPISVPTSTNTSQTVGINSSITNDHSKILETLANKLRESEKKVADLEAVKIEYKTLQESYIELMRKVTKMTEQLSHEKIEKERLTKENATLANDITGLEAIIKKKESDIRDTSKLCAHLEKKSIDDSYKTVTDSEEQETQEQDSPATVKSVVAQSNDVNQTVSETENNTKEEEAEEDGEEAEEEAEEEEADEEEAEEKEDGEEAEEEEDGEQTEEEEEDGEEAEEEENGEQADEEEAEEEAEEEEAEEEEAEEEEAEEEEAEEEEAEEEEAEEEEADEEAEEAEAEEEDGEEVEEYEYNGKTYYITDRDSGPVYEYKDDGDIGDEIGKIVKGIVYVKGPTVCGRQLWIKA